MGQNQNPFKGKDILSISDFNPQSLSYIFKQADSMRNGLAKRTAAKTLTGSVIALLFFEPSTRTHNSFSSAAQRLGAGIIGIQDTTKTSIDKGESFEDTIRMISGYSDCIVIRHSEAGSAQRAAVVSDVPIINAGDGGNEHPTQMVLDLYTVQKKFNRLHGLTCVVGIDPLHSRAIRSLLMGLSQYKNNRAYILSSQKMRLSKDLKSMLISRGLTIHEIDTEKDIPKDAHIWYWNRIQKERFAQTKEYLTYRKKFIITPELLEAKGNSDLIIMDPLPRVEEIDKEIDNDPRAHYFQQAKNGVYIRMALLAQILEK